jgi:beta-phosphoglucomutase
MSYRFAAVLFDMNGVVIDNARIHMQAWKTLILSRGLSTSGLDLESTNGRRALDVVSEVLRAVPGSEEALKLAEEYEAMHRAYLLAEKPALVPGIKSFLENLGRLAIPRALATSAAHESAETALRRTGLLEAFDQIITAEEVQHGKPDPEIFLVAAKKCQARIERCLVIEDSTAGVKAAKLAGASCLALLTSDSADNLLRCGADWVASDFRWVPEVISTRLECKDKETV